MDEILVFRLHQTLTFDLSSKRHEITKEGNKIPKFTLHFPIETRVFNNSVLNNPVFGETTSTSIKDSTNGSPKRMNR
jgi:hypothetical protein